MNRTRRVGKPSNKVPEEVSEAIEKHEEDQKKKNKISILKVSNKKENKCITIDDEDELVDLDKSINIKEEEEDEEFKIKKKRNLFDHEENKNIKKKKKQSEDDIIDEYLEEFKKAYDLKINNYFKQLNYKFNDLETNLSQSILGINEKLESFMHQKKDFGEFGERRRMGFHENSFSMPGSFGAYGSNFSTLANIPDNQMFTKSSNSFSSTSSLSNQNERQEYKPDYEKMLQMADTASSVPNLATKLLLEFFSEEELIGDVNVRGISINGCNPKKPLDPKRIDIIKKFCLDQVENGSEEKETVWKACINAMNKKIYSINLYKKY